MVAMKEKQQGSRWVGPKIELEKWKLFQWYDKKKEVHHLKESLPTGRTHRRYKKNYWNMTSMEKYFSEIPPYQGWRRQNCTSMQASQRHTEEKGRLFLSTLDFKGQWGNVWDTRREGVLHTQPISYSCIKERVEKQKGKDDHVEMGRREERQRKCRSPDENHDILKTIRTQEGSY